MVTAPLLSCAPPPWLLGVTRSSSFSMRKRFLGEAEAFGEGFCLGRSFEDADMIISCKSWRRIGATSAHLRACGEWRGDAAATVTFSRLN